MIFRIAVNIAKIRLLSNYYAGIIIGWIGTFVIDHSGRRMVAAISSFGVMVGMALLGLHFFLLDYGYDPSGLEWLMVLALLMIMLLNFGVTQMPTTLMSEIFSSDLKSVGGFVGSIMSATFAFIASKTYQPLIDLISAKYVYWIYAVIFLISLVYSLTVLPETKGKTLEVIHMSHVVTRKFYSEFENKYCMLIILPMLTGNSRDDGHKIYHSKITTKDACGN